VVERKQTDFPGHIEMGEGFAFILKRPADARCYIPLTKINAPFTGSCDRSHMDWGKKKTAGQIYRF
jgi:hypothetical protein